MAQGESSLAPHQTLALGWFSYSAECTIWKWVYGSEIFWNYNMHNIATRILSCDQLPNCLVFAVGMPGAKLSKVLRYYFLSKVNIAKL